MKKSNILLVSILLGSSLSLLAQPGNPSTPAPFGFVEILVVGGVVYGAAKKLRKGNAGSRHVD